MRGAGNIVLMAPQSQDMYTQGQGQVTLRATVRGLRARTHQPGSLPCVSITWQQCRAGLRTAVD